MWRMNNNILKLLNILDDDGDLLCENRTLLSLALFTLSIFSVVSPCKYLASLINGMGKSGAGTIHTSCKIPSPSVTFSRKSFAHFSKVLAANCIIFSRDSSCFVILSSELHRQQTNSSTLSPLSCHLFEM